MNIRGLNQVRQNMTRIQRQVTDDAARGLRKSGLLVQREAQKLVPVDTSNLKNSAFTEMYGPLKVRVGFTAEYAWYVHEDLEARHENGEAKFLQKAVTLTASERTELMIKAIKL